MHERGEQQERYTRERRKNGAPARDRDWRDGGLSACLTPTTQRATAHGGYIAGHAYLLIGLFVRDSVHSLASFIFRLFISEFRRPFSPIPNFQSTLMPCGSVLPASAFSSVDLPAPGGPRRRVILREEGRAERQAREREQWKRCSLLLLLFVESH